MVSYDVTDEVVVNAQASRGFRLGGVNDPLNQALCRTDYNTYIGFQRFNDETLWNYEVGVKSSFKKVTLNGSFFYADIDNLGVNVDAGQCSSRVTISVPRAHTMGGELELSVQPMDSLLVTFAGSYVQAEFDSTITTRIPGQWWRVSRMATASLPFPIGSSRRLPPIRFPASCVPRRVTSPRPGSSSANASPSPVIRVPEQGTSLMTFPMPA